MALERGGARVPRGEAVLAVGMGLYLAWWNLCHENGFSGLYFSSQAPNPFAGASGAALAMNCLSGFVGILCANLAASALCRRSHRFDRRILIGIACVQLGINLGVDISARLSTPLLLAAFQIAASATTFFVIIVALTALVRMELTRVVGIYALALITYGFADGLVHVPDFLMAEPWAFHHPARMAMHALILLGGASCCYAALIGKTRGEGMTPLPEASFDSIPSRRKMPVPLIVHLATYSVVFGATHALAAGVASSAFQKMLASYVGIVAAGALFYALFHCERRTKKLWPSVRQFIFPLAMLSFILLPFSGEWLALASVSLAECAQDSYFAFVFLAVLVVARKLNVSPTAAMARAGYVIAPSLMVGVACGSLLNAHASYDPQLCCMLIAGAFVLLAAGTFWVGDDRRVSLVWGLEKRLTPRKFEDNRISERCDRAAEQFGLTKRERELLPMLAEGQAASMIAEATFISPNTVRTHITRIHRKTGTHSRHELAKLLESM